jgi:V8-like Glu-specific endopeptidase
LKKTSRAFLGALAATTMGLTALAGAGNAAAQPTDSPGKSKEPAATSTTTAKRSDGTRVASAESAADVVRYWTPERRRNAIPAPGTTGQTGGSGPAAQSKPLPDDDRGGKPTGRPESTPGALPKDNSTKVARTESDAVGKVFFTGSDGRNYACSASALNSDSKQLAITAGHCVHGGRDGDWATNWVYYPRYREGDTPMGAFPAKTLTTFDDWKDNSDFRRDVAMVITYPTDQGKLVEVTGGHGLSWNYSHTEDVDVVGYPRNHNEGEVQHFCWGTTSRYGWFDPRISLKCGFQPGSSGGPWLREYDEESEIGKVNGVTSTIDSNDVNASAYFDDAVAQMYYDYGSDT